MQRKRKFLCCFFVFLCLCQGIISAAETPITETILEVPLLEIVQINRTIFSPQSEKPQVKVRIAEAGKIVIATSCAIPISLENLPLLTAGEHSLTIQQALKEGENQLVLCYYPENRVLQQIPLLLFFDSTPPQIKISPAAGEYRVKQNIHILCGDTISGCSSLRVSGSYSHFLYTPNPGNLELTIASSEQQAEKIQLQITAQDAVGNSNTIEVVYNYLQRFRLQSALAFPLTLGQLATPIPWGMGANLAVEFRNDALLKYIRFFDFGRSEFQYAYFPHEPAYMEHFTLQLGATKRLLFLPPSTFFASLQAGLSFLRIKRDPQSALSLTSSASALVGYYYPLYHEFSLFAQTRFSYIADRVVSHYSINLEMGVSYAF